MPELDLQRQLVEKRYTLFCPRSKQDLRKEYPELETYPEFKKLSAQEMVFVWYMRCTASPYNDYRDGDKLFAAIDMAWPSEKNRMERRSEYEGCSFGSEMKAAMKKMESFELTHRIKNKLYCEHFYAMLQDMSRVSIVNAAGEIDPDKGAKAALMIKNSVSTMKEISSMLEGGDFGISEEDDSYALTAGEAINHYHASKRN